MKPLAPDDLDIGREEVERLERLVGGLRRMAAHRIQRRSMAIRDLCGHAEMLLRDAAAGRPLAFAGDDGLAIRCDPEFRTTTESRSRFSAASASGSSPSTVPSRTSDKGVPFTMTVSRFSTVLTSSFLTRRARSI